MFNITRLLNFKYLNYILNGFFQLLNCFIKKMFKKNLIIEKSNIRAMIFKSQLFLSHQYIKIRYRVFRRNLHINVQVIDVILADRSRQDRIDTRGNTLIFSATLESLSWQLDVAFSLVARWRLLPPDFCDYIDCTRGLKAPKPSRDVPIRCVQEHPPGLFTISNFCPLVAISIAILREYAYCVLVHKI